MLSRKAVLVCSMIAMIGAVAAGPKVFPVIFLLVAVGMVASFALPLVTFFAGLMWFLVFGRIYSRIPKEKKRARSVYFALFAPPKDSGWISER